MRVKRLNCKPMNYLKLLPIIAILANGCSKSCEKQQNTKPFSTQNKQVEVYTTASNTTQRLTSMGRVSFGDAFQPLEGDISVFVNPNKTFQTFLGVGGAITDASAEVFAKLPKEKQEEFLKAYFGSEGNNYTLLRTNIHSCDFSSGSYTYIEEGDEELKTFSIDHDLQFRVPLIKEAIARIEGKATLYVSPWSPPAFMKYSNNMLKGDKLLPQYYQAWANYYAKFIKAYEQAGIPIWGLTIQNEPMATQIWESCIYTAEEERDFLKNYLGPTLQKNGLGDKKIIVWDHNRDLISHRANAIFDDPEASKYAWGIGYHWYETWTGGAEKVQNLANINASYPDKHILFTEGCVEKFSTEGLQRWSNAERYGRNMINDFNAGTVGFTDWNILLDETGGPNHVGNLCFSPIHGNTQTGELIYTPSYYYIGHFSRFIRPDAVRVSTTTSRSTILSTSFLNTDGSLVTIVMNETDNSISYTLYIGNSGVKLQIQPHSIQSLVY